MKTTKSPRRVLLVAHLAGRLSLPDYSHRSSPKKFTQPQLFACLVLKEFLQLDYRKLAALLLDAPSLGAAIGLKSVPHFTTFQKAADRLLLSPRVHRLLDETLHVAQYAKLLPSRSRSAALDGTGWESRHASSYFVKRRANCSKYWQKTTYTRFPKAGVLSHTHSHLILALVPGLGPGPDIKHFRRALDESLARIRIKTLYADAGYDAEHSHEYAREERGVATFIPPLIGRPTKKGPSGRWRKRMTRVLKLSNYTQRWQAETVNSMLKRMMGSALRARRHHARCRELHLRALTLNVMIVRRRRGFLQSRTETVRYRRPERLAASLDRQRENSSGVRPASASALRLRLPKGRKQGR